MTPARAHRNEYMKNYLRAYRASERGGAIINTARSARRKALRPPKRALLSVPLAWWDGLADRPYLRTHHWYKVRVAIADSTKYLKH